MATNIEREFPKGLEERAEEVSPLTIEQKEVVTPTPSQFKAQVMDERGNPVISIPPASVVTVAIPADGERLATASKGSSGDSITWWGVFWQRIIKKALHFGWRIVGGGV